MISPTLSKSIRIFIGAYGTQGVMPTARELIAAGDKSLPHAIAKYGGFSVVAKRLGLKQSDCH